MFQIAGKWFTEMSDAMKVNISSLFVELAEVEVGISSNIITFIFESFQSGILNHYGHMPEPEADYWNLPNGPAWGWWILSILPLDSQLQVNNEAFIF